MAESREHRMPTSEKSCRPEVESGRMSNLEEQSHGRQGEMERLPEETLIDKDNSADLFSKLNLKDVDNPKETATEKNLKRCIEQMKCREAESMRQVFEAKSERNTIQEKYNTLIRKQQEESFKQMESGRWLPSEESKVVGDLHRVKRAMRSWAKSTSVKDMSPIQTLDEIDVATLMKDLSHVVLLEDNQLPKGLSGPKSASLLLNALLAHGVYMSLFRSPLFLFAEEGAQHLSRAGPAAALDEIYGLAQASNEQDAHIWRSQTLRLLLPPLGSDSSDGEKHMRGWTEGWIAKVCEQHASNFIAGPARHLLDHDAKADCAKRLIAIYRDAATLSYQLWTRRTAMRCFTLQELEDGRPTFRVNDPYKVPHTLVRCDDDDGHEDELEHKPITVIVHPLLLVYGTDESRDYDQHRVWAQAEVWLDSRTSPVP